VSQGWTQGASARDRNGKAVHPWSANARSWSLLGAIICGDATRQGRLPLDQLAAAVVAVGKTLNTGSLNGWNDEPNRTRADVLAAFDATLGATDAPESLVRRSSA
jgi:hypothetical protein